MRRNLLAAASCTVLYAAHRRKRTICERAELRRAPSDASARAKRATTLLRFAEQEAAEAAAALAAETAAQTADAPSDVLVVGGGIVGASVAPGVYDEPAELQQAARRARERYGTRFDASARCVASHKALKVSGAMSRGSRPSGPNS